MEQVAEPTKVWAVSSGEYSDYSVYVLLPTEAAAARVADELGGDYFIESFDFYPETVVVHDEYRAWCNTVGATTVPEIGQTSERVLDEPPRRPKLTVSENPGSHRGHYVAAVGADPDGVVKAVKDRAAALLAGEA